MGLFKNIIKGFSGDAFDNGKNNSDCEGDALSAPKDSREVTDLLYDDDNGKDVRIEYSFMLSKDFVDSATNAGEIDYVAVYAPDCEDEFCPYDIGMSAFIVSSAPENEIYEMIDKYKHSGTPDGVYSFERVDDMGSKVYFRACTVVRGSVYYFYAMDRGISYINNYIGVMYEKELHGTALEKKMMSEVDVAVRSYKESL